MAPLDGSAGEQILTLEALAFVAHLQRTFGGSIAELVGKRSQRHDEFRAAGRGRFRAETADIRKDETWRVAPAPADLRDRRVEITGPTEAKMLINAWNSGARVHLADFEDSNTPTWSNLVVGQQNLVRAHLGSLGYSAPDGREYRLSRQTAVPVVRPRGLHLSERHLQVDGEPASAALVDFGLYFFHNAARLVSRGSAPYFYLPKLESHEEARLWNDVFVESQMSLGIPHGSVRATVLVETLMAAYEMEEILFELRDHASGLNAGRWDYLFSIIKVFRDSGPRYQLPDRNSVTMTAPFMRAYTELLVSTCHRRGAFAIGGMSAFIPNRADAELNERALSQVRADKDREAADGFDGSWVAHPDLVPIAMAAFDAVLQERPNQLDRLRAEVSVSAEELVDLAGTPGSITEAGLRNNISVSLQYLAAWLGGSGAVAIFNLMEDVATAEIARSQVWQWTANRAVLDNGDVVTPALVAELLDEELERIRRSADGRYDETRYLQARDLFLRVAGSASYEEFLTLPAYQLLDSKGSE